MLAAKGGHAEVLGVLLARVRRGCVDATDVHGASALLHAARSGSGPCVRELLRAGARPGRGRLTRRHPPDGPVQQLWQR